jgi:hypothetical protein
MACSRASAVDPVLLEEKWRASERARGEFLLPLLESRRRRFFPIAIFYNLFLSSANQLSAPSASSSSVSPVPTSSLARANRRRRTRMEEAEGDRNEKQEERTTLFSSKRVRRTLRTQLTSQLHKTSSTTEAKLLLHQVSPSLSSPPLGPSLSLILLLLHATRLSIVSTSASSRSVSLGASSSPQALSEAAVAVKTRDVDQVMPWK